MKVEKMMNLFSLPSQRKYNLRLCHQDLLKRDTVLTRFEDLPMGSFVMFVSHQWNGNKHPDPHGRQIEILCDLIRDLKNGVHTSVETDPYYVLLYNIKMSTHTSEWKKLLSNAYIW